MKMEKKYVHTLNDAQLNWAVACAAGLTPEWFSHNLPEHTVRIENVSFSPASNWKNAGPLIEQGRIEVEFAWDEAKTWWEARQSTFNLPRHVDSIHQIIDTADWPKFDTYCGPTFLVAAMRAFVASKLGNQVDVPRADKFGRLENV